MLNMHRKLTAILLALLFSGVMVIAGCEDVGDEDPGGQPPPAQDDGTGAQPGDQPPPAEGGDDDF